VEEFEGFEGEILITVRGWWYKIQTLDFCIITDVLLYKWRKIILSQYKLQRRFAIVNRWQNYMVTTQCMQQLVA